jgi:hypothetical protein
MYFSSLKVMEEKKEKCLGKLDETRRKTVLKKRIYRKKRK